MLYIFEIDMNHLLQVKCLTVVTFASLSLLFVEIVRRVGELFNLARILSNLFVAGWLNEYNALEAGDI